MASSLAERLPSAPRKPLGMRGETPHKRLVDPAIREAVARAIARAIECSGMTRKEIAAAMGYVTASGDVDQSPITRWTSGLEPPPLAKFIAIPALCDGLAVALAERNARAEIRTVISLPRLA